MFEQFQQFLDSQSPIMYVFSRIGLSSSSGTAGIPSSLWVLNSGASHHISPHLNSFVSLSLNSSISVVTADGTPMPLVGVGSVVSSHVSLSNIYYILNLTLNLVFVSQLCESEYLVYFSSSTCSVQDPQSQKVIRTCRKQRGLYILDQLKISDVVASSVDLSSFRLSRSSSVFYLWQSRLGHVSTSRLKLLVSRYLDSHDISDCSGCRLAKNFVLPFF